MRVLTVISEQEIERIKSGINIFDDDYYFAYAYIQNPTGIPLSLHYIQQYWNQARRLMKFHHLDCLVELEINEKCVIDDETGEPFKSMAELIAYRHACMVSNKDCKLWLVTLPYDRIVCIYSVDKTKSRLYVIEPKVIERSDLYPIIPCKMYLGEDNSQYIIDQLGTQKALDLQGMVHWVLCNGITGYLEDMTYGQVTASCTGFTRRVLDDTFGKVTDEEDKFTIESLRQARGMR